MKKIIVSTLVISSLISPVYADSLIKSVTSSATGGALNALKGVGEGGTCQDSC